MIGIQRRLQEIGATVTQNLIAWRVIERTAAILEYSIRHFQASTQVYTDGKWDKEKVQNLDDELLQIIGWLEEDWDRNRFVRDPGKDGYALGFWGHTLYWLKLAHGVHGRILADSVASTDTANVKP